jgi:serine/threonine protein kinase
MRSNLARLFSLSLLPYHPMSILARFLSNVTENEVHIKESSQVVEIMGGIPYLVMDYAPHGSLQQRYPLGTPVVLHLVCDYVRQIAAALTYLHGKRLIHRDVKPGNVLLGARDELFLSDFGIAVAMRGAQGTGRRVVVGTSAYMAPEQIRGEALFASDQYALGVMVYQWLCGALPFHGTSLAVRHQRLSVPPPSLRAHNLAISPAAEGVVLRALAKDPRERFESVQAFAEALDRACGGSKRLGISTPLPQVQPTPGEASGAEGGGTKKLWRAMASASGLSLLTGLALGILLRVLGVTSPVLWWLVPLCLVLSALGGAAWRRILPVFALTCAITVAAALPAVLLQSITLFAVASLVLQGLNALVALSVLLNWSFLSAGKER